MWLFVHTLLCMYPKSHTEDQHLFLHQLFLHQQWKLVLGRRKAEAMASAPPVKAAKAKAGKDAPSAVMLAFGAECPRVAVWFQAGLLGSFWWHLGFASAGFGQACIWPLIAHIFSG